MLRGQPFRHKLQTIACGMTFIGANYSVSDNVFHLRASQKAGYDMLKLWPKNKTQHFIFLIFIRLICLPNP